MTTRNPWIDQIKGIACLLIVIHHLAFYGPMTDVLEPFLNRTVSWFRDYARMAVQIFLVLGGYLSAAALAPNGYARHSAVAGVLVKRFVRLVVPYVVAVMVTVAITEGVRFWGFSHGSMSATPTLLQFLAHIFLLHGILGLESLSAGAWYVAIDFQLFALVVLGFGLGRRLQGPLPSSPAGITLPQIGVVLLTLGSLWFWNLESDFDVWAIYFFGAYGLGMMAWWATHDGSADARRGWHLVMIALVVIALVVDWRDRIALAGITALSLVWFQALRWPSVTRWLLFKPLQYLGQISYSVFLVHFGISLLVNAVVFTFWPNAVSANAIGVLFAIMLSVAGGALLYRWVESKQLPWLMVGRPAVSSGPDRSTAKVR